MKNMIIIATLLATSALTNFAQDSERGRPERRGPGGPGGPGRPPLIAGLDANKDGKLDATEIANAGNIIGALDKNGDGQVTVDELRPAPPAGAPERPAPPADAPKRPMPPLLAAIDVDKDGALSATELAGTAAALAKLDKNTDGVLTPDEFMGDRGPGKRGPDDRGPRGPGRKGPQE